MPARVIPAEQSDLTSLIHRIAGGDRNALAELYDLTVSKVFALARLIVRNPADAEEVVCDVYTQVWRSAGSYQGDRGEVMGWLLVMCRSRALDLSRRNRLRARVATLEVPHSESDCLEQSVEDILDLMKQESAVHRALRKLTPLRRNLIALAFFRGLTHMEIAKECELPVGTVKSHIRRALTAMRAELAAVERPHHAEGDSDAASLA